MEHKQQLKDAIENATDNQSLVELARSVFAECGETPNITIDATDDENLTSLLSLDDVAIAAKTIGEIRAIIVKSRSYRILLLTWRVECSTTVLNEGTPIPKEIKRAKAEDFGRGNSHHQFMSSPKTYAHLHKGMLRVRQANEINTMALIELLVSFTEFCLLIIF
jgi:hypothetical protein